MSLEKIKDKLEFELNFCLARARILAEREPLFEEIAQLLEKTLLRLKLINTNSLY